MEKFKIVSNYKPTGDQPAAIKELVEGLQDKHKFQTLLGVTGSGKTFTMANVIAQVQKSTLVLVHNKTILLTTHDTELALEYASKLWLLGKENYFEEGNPDALVESGLINKLFTRDGVVFNVKNRRFEKA